MKVLRNIVILAALAALTQGCLRDNDILGPSNETVLIQLKMPETSKTRADVAPSDEEYDIDHLDVLVFADKGGDADTFLYHTVPTEEITTGPDYPITRTYVLPIRRSMSGEKQKLVLIANLEDEVEALISAELSDPATAKTKTKSYLMSKLTFEDRFSGWESYGIGLPMWGESPTSSLITATSTGSAFGNVDMLFSVAKIEVGINGNADFSEVNPFNDLFVLGNVAVANRVKLGYAAPQAGAGYANNKVSAPSVPTTNEVIAGPQKILSTTSFNTKIKHASFYVQEVDNSDRSNDEGMFLLLSGYYTAPGASQNSSVLTWYRVDFYDRSAADPQAAKLDILRGHRYLVNITGVDGPGYPSAEEAAASYTSKMTATVTEWSEWSREMDPAGAYKLDVSESEWSFNGLERTADDTNNKVAISTDHPDGWEVASITDTSGNAVDWLTMSPTSGAAGTPVTASINLTAYNSQTPRTGRITIEAGKWSYVIHVAQQLSSLTISPAELVLDFDYYPLPLARTKLSFENEGGWMFDHIEYTTTETTGWLSVIDPVVANPLQIFEATTDLPADEVRTADNAYLRVKANPEAAVRTANVYFKTEDGAEAVVEVRQGWIEAGAGGVPKEMQVGENKYRTHIYGTNIRRIGESMQAMGYFDALSAYYNNSSLKDNALAYIYALPDENTFSCFMIDNSREGDYYMEYFNDDPDRDPAVVGPYYWTDRTIEGKRYTSASACPEGWRLPNAEDYNNIMIGCVAMNSYGLTHYAPDYVLWAGDENFVGGMGQSNVKPSTTTVSWYTNCSPGGDYAYWHSGYIDDNGGNSGGSYGRYERTLYVSRDSYYENYPAGVYIGSSSGDYYYEYIDNPANSYVNMHLLPVRCVQDVDMMHYPMHNE